MSTKVCNVSHYGKVKGLDTMEHLSHGKSFIADTKEATEFPEALIVHIASAHRLPFHKWKTK